MTADEPMDGSSREGGHLGVGGQSQSCGGNPSAVWVADADSGMLQGWGTPTLAAAGGYAGTAVATAASTTATAAPGAAPGADALAAPGGEAAAAAAAGAADAGATALAKAALASEVLQNLATAEVPDIPEDRAAELFADLLEGADARCDEATAAKEEGSDADEGALDLPSDDELRASVEKLQALLRDNAAFHEACEAAFSAVESSRDIEGARPITPRPQLNSKEELRLALNHICEGCGIEEVEEEEATDLYDGPMDAGVFYQLAREYFQSLCRTLTMAM